jgi:hypothetical protein
MQGKTTPKYTRRNLNKEENNARKNNAIILKENFK